MKPAENGQPEHQTQVEEISLALGLVWAHLNFKDNLMSHFFNKLEQLSNAMILTCFW